MKTVPGGIMHIAPRQKPRISLAKGLRMPGAYLLINNAPWLCSAPGMIPAYGGSAKNAFFLFCIANGLSYTSRKASDSPQVARKPFIPGEGSHEEVNAASEKLNPFSKEGCFIAGTWVGFFCGLLFAWLVSR